MGAKESKEITSVTIDGDEMKVTDSWYRKMVRDIEITASIGFSSKIKNYAGVKGKVQAISYKDLREGYAKMFTPKNRLSCTNFGSLFGGDKQEIFKNKKSGLP